MGDQGLVREERGGPQGERSAGYRGALQELTFGAPSLGRAQVVDVKPEPSLLGAGGLPKGAINLGEEADEGVRERDSGILLLAHIKVALPAMLCPQFNALW